MQKLLEIKWLIWEYLLLKRLLIGIDSGSNIYGWYGKNGPLSDIKTYIPTSYGENIKTCVNIPRYPINMKMFV